MKRLGKMMALLLCMLMMTGMLPTLASAVTVLPDNVDFDTNGGTVYCPETNTYYATLQAAVKAVRTTNQTSAVLYCKPGANVGNMSHADVECNLTIYGNGATVPAVGDADLSFDTFNGYLERDVTVSVYDLNGIAAWGQRHTNHTINLYFSNCKNMNRVYISGTTGTNNIKLENCTFVESAGSSDDTSVYSNTPGTIEISGCVFDGVAIPINLNNKSSGTQTIKVDGCIFNDCSNSTVIAPNERKTYAASIRIVAQANATSNLTVTNTTFGGTDAGNGEILLGDGRHNGQGATGTITLATSNTAAEIAQQSGGYYDANGDVADTGKNKITTITANQQAIANTSTNFVIITPETSSAVSAPKTGDNSNLMLWAGLMILAVIGMALAGKKRMAAER